MARAPLRPVPGQPAEPVTDAAAVTLVAAALPSLADPDRTALALVALAGMPRRHVALRLGRDEADLADSLARARKELRRTVAALGGSGWCERSERMISDRLDGALADSDVRRLDVHLRNCPRCVEHERRLVQATDALVASATGVPYAFQAGPSPAAPSRASRAEAPAAGEEPEGTGNLLRALPLQALIAVTVLLALAAVVLAAVALGLQL
jgi:Putative zinc-finger